jgi:hypothetical protein
MLERANAENERFRMMKCGPDIVGGNERIQI